jgi:two-component system, OmpR family, alkaline phosphatase synthesis response regulator PhoP
MAQILVVDDEKDVIELLRFVLEKDGHKVFAAEDGSEGYAAAVAKVPDLIILDIMMPGMDGYTLATKLKSDQATRKIPIVILTAKGQMKEVFQAEENVRAYVEKPFDPKELRDLIVQKALL